MLFLLMTAETGDELSEDLKERNKILDKDLRKLARGKSQALDEVYELTKGAVYGFIFSILKNEEDSEDVMQDTFVSVHYRQLIWCHK